MRPRSIIVAGVIVASFVSTAHAAPSPTDRTILGTVPAALRFEIPRELPRPLPTNRWWSSGILEPWPSPLYAWPLVATMRPDGVTLDAPGRRVQDKTVFADARSPIRVFVPGS